MSLIRVLALECTEAHKNHLRMWMRNFNVVLHTVGLEI